MTKKTVQLVPLHAVLPGTDPIEQPESKANIKGHSLKRPQLQLTTFFKMESFPR